MDVQIRVKRPLLDAVAEVLVADPGASLAEVAQAVGISRTTLHNHYATREDRPACGATWHQIATALATSPEQAELR